MPHAGLWPTTRAGRWSVGFLVAAFALLATVQVLVASGQRGGETFSDNWLIAGPMFAALACSLTGAVLGLLSVVRLHERTLSVMGAIGIGGLALVFVLGEVLLPH